MNLSFKYFKHNPAIIQLAVLLYVRYPLSLRQVEDMLFDRGIDICHETIRLWWNKFGPLMAAPEYQSLFPDTLHENWTRVISDSGPDRFDELPQLNRLSDPSIMSKLYRGMEDKQAIQIQYTSMTTGKDDGQWIAPTRFASDGDRIHVRAFSFKHDEYRDYVPVRIATGSSFKTRPLAVDLPVDEDWDMIARIQLVPKAGLTDDQKKAVRREYGFTGKSLCIETRKSLEFYADRRWGLDQDNARLERYSTEYFPLKI